MSVMAQLQAHKVTSNLGLKSVAFCASSVDQSLTGCRLSTKIITVAVGSEPKLFFVHEDLLRSRSTFFSASLSPDWQVGAEGRVSLRDDSQATVNLYLQHLYTRKISTDWTADSEDIPENFVLPEHMALAHAYVFGEKIGDIPLKDAVVDAFFKMINKRIQGRRIMPKREVVDVIFRGTTSCSPLRKLMVDIHLLSAAKEDWISPSPEDNSIHFIVDLTRGTIRVGGANSRKQ